ncbi:hypothetical protein, partial [Enterocloster clostridioformis]
LMIIDFIIEDLMLNSYLQKNFHTLLEIKSPEKRGCEKSGVEMLHFPQPPLFMPSLYPHLILKRV